MGSNMDLPLPRGDPGPMIARSAAASGPSSLGIQFGFLTFALRVCVCVRAGREGGRGSERGTGGPASQPGQPCMDGDADAGGEQRIILSD